MFTANVFASVAEYLRERTVQLPGGSGVVWSADGLIVTNAHVLRGEATKVELADGRKLEGRVTKRDPRRDLAAVRVEATHLPHVAIADSSTVRAGEIVFAAGNPFGVNRAVTQGVIHTAGGTGWIQADVQLAPGNSGGALANACGEVIGINTMIYGGLALAIPSNAVTRFLEGRQTPRLGVTLHPVQAAGRDGVMILELEADGPAAQAGLQTGDVILLSISDLRTLLEASSDKAEMRLDFLRAGRVLSNVISFRLAATEARAA